MDQLLTRAFEDLQRALAAVRNYAEQSDARLTDLRAQCITSHSPDEWLRLCEEREAKLQKRLSAVTAALATGRTMKPLGSGVDNWDDKAE